MRVLLETHAGLWADFAPSKLSRLAASGALQFEKGFEEIPERTGHNLLPIAVQTGLRSGRLLGSHGDPFDRVIAAQALEKDVDVISNDAALDVFGIRGIWKESAVAAIALISRARQKRDVCPCPRPPS